MHSREDLGIQPPPWRAARLPGWLPGDEAMEFKKGPIPA